MFAALANFEWAVYYWPLLSDLRLEIFSFILCVFSRMSLFNILSILFLLRISHWNLQFTCKLQLFTPLEPMYPPALCENMRQMQTSCLFQLIRFFQKMIEKFSFNCIGPEPMDICTTSTSQPCEFLKSDVTILEGHKSEVKYFLNASCLCFGFFC